MIIDQQDIIISAGGNGNAVTKKYRKYLADNIGVIHDGSGAIDDTERVFGGISDSGASDRSDWLVLDFQTHSLTRSGNYYLFIESLRYHLQINVELAASAAASFAGQGGDVYPMTQAFTFSALTSSNIPTLGAAYPYTAFEVDGSNVGTSAKTYSFEIDESTAINTGTYSNLYGIIIKIRSGRVDTGGALDATVYNQLLNDNVYILEMLNE